MTLRWVLSEWSAMMPTWASALFLGEPMTMALHLTDKSGSIERQAREVTAPLSLLQSESDPNLLPLKRPIVVDVHVPVTAFLARQIEAPAKAANKIRSIATFDLTRRTPLRPEDVVWTISGVTTQGGKAVATQWLLRSEDVVRLDRRLRQLGLTMRRIIVAGQAFAEPIVVGSAQTHGRARFWQRVNAVLAVSAMALAAALWLGPSLTSARTLGPAAAELDALRERTLAVRLQVEELRNAASKQAQFIDGLFNRPRLSQTLRELTVALPDHIWAQELRFDTSSVTLIGETTGSAADLVISLADIEAFSDPRLLGTVSIAAAGGERFELALDHARETVEP